jgi:hypothetical protein
VSHVTGRGFCLYWDMRPRRAAKALLALLGLLAGASAPALAQMNEYEMRYGQTIEVSVDNLLQMPEQYVGKAVRTRAQLEMMPSLNRVYALRGTFGGYLYLYPVPEVAQDFENEMKKFLGKEVEVTGGVGTGKDPNTGQTIVYLQVWAFLGPPDEKPGRRPDTAQVTLEDLVTKAERFDGKLVTVRGQFRGSNLFGDLPSASRQRSSDWVLKEEVFAVWVSGKKAKGEGWTLDPDLRRDTGKWVQVTGRVRVDSRVVTIQATDVVLAKAPSADAAVKAEAAPVPPPPPRPKKPPAVVFALPLDGERDVPPDSVFKVQFSKDMDEESFKDRVVFRYAGRPQPGDNALDARRITYDGGLRTLQVDPGDLLRPGRVVELLLLPGIVDLDGLPLETRPGKNPGAAADVLRFQVAGGSLLGGP